MYPTRFSTPFVLFSTPFVSFFFCIAILGSSSNLNNIFVVYKVFDFGPKCISSKRCPARTIFYIEALSATICNIRQQLIASTHNFHIILFAWFLLDAPIINKVTSSNKVNSYLNNGKTVYLWCHAEGEPEPTYHWVNPIGFDKTNDKKSNKYPLQQPKFDEFGPWRCKANNSVGFDEHIVTVHQISKSIKHVLWLHFWGNHFCTFFPSVYDMIIKKSLLDWMTMHTVCTGIVYVLLNVLGFWDFLRCA